MKIRWMAALAAAMQITAGARTPPGPADVVVYLVSDGPIVTYQASTLAASMFQGIGVRVAWRNGEPAGPTPGGVTLRVRLTSGPRNCHGPEVLACAYPYARVDRAITVFYDQIQESVRGTLTPAHVLLAHVLAHEIAHVLQRIDRHSDAGILKPVFNLVDKQAMIDGPLRFEPADAYLIHRGLSSLRLVALK